MADAGNLVKIEDGCATVRGYDSHCHWFFNWEGGRQD